MDTINTKSTRNPHTFATCDQGCACRPNYRKRAQVTWAFVISKSSYISRRELYHSSVTHPKDADFTFLMYCKNETKSPFFVSGKSTHTFHSLLSTPLNPCKYKFHHVPHSNNHVGVKSHALYIAKTTLNIMHHQTAYKYIKGVLWIFRVI